MAEMIVVDWQTLQSFTQQIFHAAGMPEEDAATEAKVLVWANLRGVDSHGVLRVIQYLRSIKAGGMNPTPDIRLEVDTPAATLIEADHAFGPVVTTMAMNKTIVKAKNVGIAWTEIRNTTHQGAMAYYALMAAEAGLAGIAIVCNPPNMAPFGAKAPGVHNSPIAIAVPGGSHRPLCLDMATSMAAGGKVNLAADKGIPIPLGWAIDKEGKPTTDPHNVGALLPFGGPKASGMALMFETLTSLMVGNPLLARRADQERHPGTQNSVIAAVDVGLFTDLDTYREDADRLVGHIKGLPKADGVDEIYVPGEIEDRVYAERLEKGIPLPMGTVENLKASAAQVGVSVPDELQ